MPTIFYSHSYVELLVNDLVTRVASTIVTHQLTLMRGSKQNGLQRLQADADHRSQAQLPDVMSNKRTISGRACVKIINRAIVLRGRTNSRCGRGCVG